jgi:alkylated DNA repair protein alkB family protein 8
MEKSKIFENQEVWDKIAFSFDKTRKKPWVQCLDFIDKLKNDYIVADIGSGNGRHTIPCAKKCNKVIAIDISKNLLKIVKQKANESNLSNIYLIQSDAIKLPINNISCDAVLFIASLHNIKCKINRISSLNEIHRILKKEGIALISVWSRWQDKFRKEFFKKIFTQINKNEFGDIDIYWNQHGLNIPRFYHLYSKREFISELKKANFEILDFKEVKIKSKKYPDNFFAFVKKL